MTKSEAKRIAYAVVSMVIQDSNAYDLITHWAKNDGEAAQLRDALTEVRDLLESRAGMAEQPPADSQNVQTGALFEDDEPVVEIESK